MKLLKKFIKFYFLLSAFCFINYLCLGQGISLGQWRDHLPYNNCVAVAEAGNKIYCATEYCLFVFDKTDNSITRLNKINGLSDFGVSTIKYSSKYQILLIAYTNTNIDIIDNNGGITNIPDIKTTQIIGSKTINRISFIGNYAYLACSFGIVVLDPAQLVIKDTYYIGPNGSAINVNDISSVGDTLYAATDKGIYVASLSSPNLADYNSWHILTSIPKPYKAYNTISCFNGKIYTNQHNIGYNIDTMYIYNDTTWSQSNIERGVAISSMEITCYNELVICNSGFVYIFDDKGNLMEAIYSYNPGIPQPADAIIDKDNNLWIADNLAGLKEMEAGNWNLEAGNREFNTILPNGPATKDVFSMAIAGNNLWVATGGVDATWNNMYMQDGVFYYDFNNWRSFTTDPTNPAFNTGGMYDYIGVAIDPNNNNIAYIGTWSRGLLEFNNQQLATIYNDSNSSLQYNGATGSNSRLRIGGMCFDNNHNMWVSNSGAINPISVMFTSNGNTQWYSYYFNNFLYGYTLNTIIIDNYGQKWVILPRGRGIFVFNDNGTITDISDDQYKILSNDPVKGNLPSSNVLSIANDLNGEIWIGTNQGVAVIYSPGDVFVPGANDWYAQQILVMQNGNWQYLLYTESVTAIAVDGANRKWLGTMSSGVFLMSPDGTTLIQHFTEDNSPLLSNSITSIAINNQTGEVFFGTNNGIISYKSDATEGAISYQQSSVYAYPNPVRHDYNGPIAIKGLVTNSDVRITSINGNLVYSTTALGGQAIWYGRNFEGEQLQTGVYLVFCTNDDGSETLVTKILLIH